jgi:hypothetical protein
MDQKIKVDVSSASWEKCECGGKMFESVYLFKRVSALMSPNGQELHIPMEVFRCKDCKGIPKFVSDNIPDMPEELKALKPEPK